MIEILVRLLLITFKLLGTSPFACRTEDTLGELLKEIEAHSGSVRFEAMANIIAVHSQAEGMFAVGLIMYICMCPPPLFRDLFIFLIIL